MKNVAFLITLLGLSMLWVGCGSNTTSEEELDQDPIRKDMSEGFDTDMLGDTSVDALPDTSDDLDFSSDAASDQQDDMTPDLVSDMAPVTRRIKIEGEAIEGEIKSCNEYCMAEGMTCEDKTINVIFTSASFEYDVFTSSALCDEIAPKQEDSLVGLGTLVSISCTCTVNE